MFPVKYRGFLPFKLGTQEVMLHDRSIVKGEWVFWGFTLENCSGRPDEHKVPGYNNNFWWLCIPETICCWSGLRDQCKTDIYRGDKLWDSVNDEWYVVDFTEGKFVAYTMNDNLVFDLCELNADVQVRGSIFDKEYKEKLED